MPILGIATWPSVVSPREASPLKIQRKESHEGFECRDMKRGEVYVCEACGIELQVVKECDHKDAENDASTCGFTCYGEPLKLRSKLRAMLQQASG